MNSLMIKKTTLDNSANRRQLQSRIPAGPGLLIFRRENSVISYFRTNNLLKLSDHLFYEPDVDLSSLDIVIDKYDTIEVRSAEDSFAALVMEKNILQMETPEHYDIAGLAEDYVYLALNTKQKPYISIRPDTIGDDWFIGPFSDRFFLVGVIELFCKYRLTPACRPFFKEATPKITSLSEMVHKSEGCDRETNADHNCFKYCDKEKAEDLIQTYGNSYLDPCQSLLNELTKKHEELHNSLRFLEAERVKKELQICESYYRMLRFLTITKQLNYWLKNRGADYYIEDGLLVNCKRDDKEIIFESNAFKDYLSNELLAIPKDSFQERFTLFEKLESTDPVYINELYERVSTKTLELFMKENI